MSEDATPDQAAQLSFKVKTSGEGSHDITIPETATVLQLKDKLGGKDYEDIPAARQRLIYSGRVLKDDQVLSTYKIKPGNTIHMVKSAAPPSGASAAASQPANATVPTNIAAGTANNPLANLTSARYAGHNLNLPGLEAFGADGGMGAPPSSDQVADMLSNPNTAQMMNEALDNPQLVDAMIQANPQLRAMGPQARQLIQSPMFRRMMTDPGMLRQAARLSSLRSGPAETMLAPGSTPTAAGVASSDSGASTGAGAANPLGGMMNGMSLADMQEMMQALGGFGGLSGASTTPSAPATPQNTATNPGQPDTAANGAANPFAALFGGAPPSGGAGGAPASPFGGMSNLPPPTPEQIRQAMQMFGGGGAGGANPFAAMGLPEPTPEEVQRAMQMMGGMGAGDPGGSRDYADLARLMGSAGSAGAGGAPAAPADTRPPEEQYADELRQLNDMGFFDFDENVRCLRRAGGSVQGAIEQLLGGN